MSRAFWENALTRSIYLNNNMMRLNRCYNGGRGREFNVIIVNTWSNTFCYFIKVLTIKQSKQIRIPFAMSMLSFKSHSVYILLLYEMIYVSHIKIKCTLFKFASIFIHLFTKNTDLLFPQQRKVKLLNVPWDSCVK